MCALTRTLVTPLDRTFEVRQRTLHIIGTTGATKRSGIPPHTWLQMHLSDTMLIAFSQGAAASQCVTPRGVQPFCGL